MRVASVRHLQSAGKIDAVLLYNYSANRPIQALFLLKCKEPSDSLDPRELFRDSSCRALFKRELEQLSLAEMPVLTFASFRGHRNPFFFSPCRQDTFGILKGHLSLRAARLGACSEPMKFPMQLRAVSVTLAIAATPAVSASAPPLQQGFDQTVRPFVMKYCVGCHSGSMAAAQFDLQVVHLRRYGDGGFSRVGPLLKDRLTAKEMPPQAEMPPPPEEATRQV